MNLYDLGQRIKFQRNRRNLTQKQLAHSLFISPQAVSKWERGENAPDITLLPKLSTLLEKPIEWILTGDAPRESTFEATVFYTSIRTFLSKTADMPPATIAHWINGHFHTLTELCQNHQGVPVKYMGDGILAYFSGDKNRQRALDAAMDILKTEPEDGFLISIHSGQIYLGSLGHPDYKSLDIIGDTVNQSFMLNRWATDKTDSALVVSEDAMPQKLQSFRPLKTNMNDIKKVYEYRP